MANESSKQPKLTVFFFDSMANARPYLVIGDRVVDAVIENGGKYPPTPVKRVYRGDVFLAQVEFYRDINTKDPSAYHRFLTRLDGFEKSLTPAPDQIQTLVFGEPGSGKSSFAATYRHAKGPTAILDSLTLVEYAARKDAQYRLKNAKYYYASTDEVEELLIGRFGSFVCNTCVVAHVGGREKTMEQMGSEVRAPAAPGRLMKDKPLAAAFGEVYYAKVARNQESGELEYVLQTRSDGEFQGKSQIGAPNPCEPDYRMLWVQS